MGNRVPLDFLKRSAGDRRVYFEEAARKRGLSPVIIEKDFWVCWMLSKVFGAIARFSEDIDLSISPEYLGLADVTNPATLSGNQAEKWMKAALSSI